MSDTLNLTVGQREFLSSLLVRFNNQDQHLNIYNSNEGCPPPGEQLDVDDLIAKLQATGDAITLTADENAFLYQVVNEFNLQDPSLSHAPLEQAMVDVILAELRA